MWMGGFDPDRSFKDPARSGHWVAASLHRHPASVSKDVSALAEVLVQLEKVISAAGIRCTGVSAAFDRQEIALQAE
jgi:hypothetical protein